ncbi:MAG: AAA family ATPase [Fusobacterium sp.]
MKVKSIQFKNHKVLKNLKIDFLDKEGKILDLIVLAGSNGSGKTNVLEGIYNHLEKPNNYIDIALDIEYSEKEQQLDTQLHNNSPLYLKILDHYKNNNQKIYSAIKKIYDKEEELPKIIYFPTEINFSKVDKADDKFSYTYQFFNKVESNLVKNIPSYLSSMVRMIQKQDEDLSYKEAKLAVATKVNEIFSDLDLNIKMIGFTKGIEDLPLFRNKQGEEFNINGLSSGEKQLFVRALTLDMIHAENSIILIDEPEISLHPQWQQKIINVYRNMGKNNQVIIATHSPHILSSVPKDSIKILEKTPNGIEILDCEENTYGQSMEVIFKDIMGMKTTINPNVFNKLEKIKKLISEDKEATDEFKILYKEVRGILGEDNENIILLKLELNYKKNMRKRGE